MFKKPFSFTGRIRRLEYGLSFIIYFAGLVAIMSLEEFNLSDEIFGTIAIVLFIPLIWFFLAQCAKRCHDRGNNGWYQLIPLYRYILIFAPGDEGENEYGFDPKEDHHESQNDILDDELIRYD